MRVGWKRLAVWSLILLLSLTGACTTGERPAGEIRSELRIATPFTLTPLNPLLSFLGMASSLIHLVSDGLVEDYRGGLLLADSITTNDSKVWKIHLRDGVQFHDGTLLRADDVVNMIEILRNNTKSQIIRDRFQTIRTVRKVSPLELEITLSEANIYFRHYLDFGILPARLFPASDFGLESFLKNPVATGPYRLVSYAPSHAKFVRFDGYFRGSPRTRSVEVLKVESKEEAWTRFLRKEIDFVIDSYADAALLPTMNRSLHSHLVTPPYGYSMALNVYAAPLSNRAVRRAIAMSIRRSAFHRFAAEISGPYPEWIPASQRLSRPPIVPFDPVRASELLEREGWRHPERSAPRVRGKARLQFELRYYADDELMSKVARSITRDLYDIGIEVKLVPAPWKDVLAHMRTQKSGAALLFYPAHATPDRLRDLFHSSRAKEGYNYSGYANPEIDADLDQARTLVDEEKRRAVYRRVFEILKKDVPAIFLFWRRMVVPMDRCWKNVELVSGNILGNTWKWSCTREH